MMPAPRERTVLLTGYGWFAGIPEGETNNAELIARALDGALCEACGVRGRVHSLILPVTWAGAFPPVEAAIRKFAPDIVLSLGTDARAAAMRPEPWGVNWQRGQDADPLGPGQEMDAPILPGEPDALRGTLPFEAITLAMLRAGIPAQLGGLSPAQEGAPLPVRSTTGLYLCNKMAYLLADTARRTGIRAGFMHVPTQPAYAAARRLRELQAASGAQQETPLASPFPPSMALETMIEGVRIALGACLEASAHSEV